ncbi:S-adenosyl-L-methionine-dependent methyltransferase [Artemisia annua]|uniref:S-adenosyl-L-methionine-dependent methyltransferase n=1 Tax=Artemisia annua TaxID=35608 RepID=A0A2U1MF54_ARTAN|nr:S-adenosyl-L-methionine-dependent methyltransferase [Artemisia annua]
MAGNKSTLQYNGYHHTLSDLTWREPRSDGTTAGPLTFVSKDLKITLLDDDDRTGSASGSLRRSQSLCLEHSWKIADNIAQEVTKSVDCSVLSNLNVETHHVYGTKKSSELQA